MSKTLGLPQAVLLTLCTLAVLLVKFSGDVYHLLTLENVALHKHVRPRVVVSLTSFGERIMVTGLSAINSLVSQPYDRFIISIPLHPRPVPENVDCAKFGGCIEVYPLIKQNDTESDIVEFLQSHLGPFLKSGYHRYNNANHSILLQFLEKDYGPATKLIGALLVEKDPRTVIVTVDDDIAYDSRIIDELSTWIPMHGALCTACQTISKALIHDGSWHRWLWSGNAKKCPGWLQGWAAVAYRVGFFGADVFNVSMPPGCFYNDDVWLSGYLKRRGVGLYVMPTVKGGKHGRHPTLSLSVRKDTEKNDMDPCIQFWAFG